MAEISVTDKDGKKLYTFTVEDPPEFEYTEEYRDQYIYLVSEYSATGEGSIVSILVYRGSFGDALKIFHEEFGYFAKGVEQIPSDEFWTTYRTRVPEFVFNVVHTHSPPAFVYHSQYHLNFS